MAAAPTPTAARRLGRAPVTAVLGALAVVAALTVSAAVLGSWVAVVVGLVLLHLGTAAAVLGPWGRRATATPPVRSPAAPPATTAGPGPPTEDLRDLAARVDGLGARLLAVNERTRVELLDAVAGSAARAEPTPDPDR